MKLETFFEKFDQFAEAPDAVSKMRELVLDLAVKGKLVPQDANDEPVSNLLDAISQRKAALVQEGFIPKPSSLSTVTEDVPFFLPNTWQWIRLESICEVITKGSSPTWQGVQYVESSSGVLFITSENVGNYVLRKMDEPKYVEKKFNEMEKRSILQRDDLLVNLVGASIGRCAIFDRDDLANINQAVGLIRLVRGDTAVDRRYLLHYLNSPTSLEIMFDEQVETARANLSLTNMKQFLIPLPPLAEQKRIVVKVDELMALCDRLEAQLKEREERASKLARASLARFAESPTPENLEYLFHKSYTIPPADLRKSILTLAIQGKLVPQDPNDEPAEVLLEQIAAHKVVLAQNGKLRGSTTVKPMVDDEAEFELPSNWRWVRFGEIMINRDGERIPISKEERETKAKLYDYYGASGVIDKIDGYLFDKPLLLIGEDGANLISRSTPIAFIARGQYWVNNHAHVLDGISEEFLKFIELHINAINLEKYVTGSAQPKMNQAKMNSIPIALPPLAEQQRIVAKVEQLMALVDELEQQLAASRATAANLLSALLAELTGAPNHGKVSVLAATTTGRRGRPAKT